MSCALGHDGSALDIAASFLKVRLRRDGLRSVSPWLVTERLRSTRRCS